MDREVQHRRRKLDECISLHSLRFVSRRWCPMSGWEAAKLYTVLPCAESDLHVQVNVSYALFSVRQPCVMPTLPECPVSILGVRGVTGLHWPQNR